jgi:hypothetical protein
MNRISRYAALAACLAILAGCAGHRAFYRQPPPETASVTSVQYAKKVLQHHNVLGTEIVALRRDPTVSGSSKAALLEGYRISVCSAEELAAAAQTADCRHGPSWQADRAIAAYEALASAQTEAEMQAASDALFALVADLIDLIAGVR